MIKVGQIYEEKDEGVFVITKCNNSGGYYAVKNDGKTFSGVGLDKKDIIVEYPTWQEAVNSPEFKGEK